MRLGNRGLEHQKSIFSKGYILTLTSRNYRKLKISIYLLFIYEDIRCVCPKNPLLGYCWEIRE